MAIPTAAIVAYKERGEIVRLAAYIIAAIAVIYALYKLFGMFREAGEKVEQYIVKPVENVAKGVKEGAEEISEYGWTRPLTPDDTAEIITKRASKNPNETYLVEEHIYNALKEQGKELPKNVKPYKPDYSKVERKTSTIGSKLGLWTPKKGETEKKSQVVPRYISQEEYKNLQAKRWEAIAKYYQKEEKIHHLPVKRVLPIRTPIHAL